MLASAAAAMLLAVTPGLTQQILSTAAGGGLDNLPALAANLWHPEGVTRAPSGDLYITATGLHRIFRMDASGRLYLVAGHGGDCFQTPYGDVLPAGRACLSSPSNTALDSAGNLAIADTGHNAVRRIDALSGAMIRVASNWTAGSTGDGLPATAASLNGPTDVAVGRQGGLFIADSFNDRIRRVDAATGIVTTAAGDGTRSYGADGGGAVSSSGYDPVHILVDAAGTVYFSTPRYPRVRTLSPGPVAAGAVPDGSGIPGRPLAVTRAAGGDLTLSWGPTCSSTDDDYEVYEGPLGDFDGHAARLCSTGGLTSATFTPAAGDTWYVVVPRNGGREGSYGLRSDGAERPAAASACLPRLIAAACP